MTRLRPFLALLPLVLAPATAHADGTWMDALRAERWAEADALATQMPDPVVRTLVEYYRLLTPGAARAPELAAFLTDNAHWPAQAQLVRRLGDTLQAERDERGVTAWCDARAARPTLPPCPDAVLSALRRGGADAARSAWVRGVEPAAEQAFVRLWGPVLTGEDHWRRFDRLVAADTGLPGSPAARQAARLDLPKRATAEARLALRRDDPAPSTALLPAQPDPTLVLDLARWLRRMNRDAEAAQVWVAHGAAAEAAAPDRRGAFWDERNLLTRRMLRLGSPAVAYALASSHAQTGEGALDAEFLAGWIALRRLNDPSGAARHFRTLAGLSKAAITQGRAQYWVGRAAAALDQADAAAAAYQEAVAWPLTYYGQHAARLLGEDAAALTARIAAVQDPPYAAGHVQDWAGRELARAAVHLVAAGEPRRAKPFLSRLDDGASVEGRAILARLATGLGLPDTAVALARRAGRDGVVLGGTGWPTPVSPPGTVERAVALALIRQESSFDVQAASPVGARGLMQLMPATATAVARRLNEPADLPALTRDPAYNMRLGTAYLQSLLNQFGGALPLALAAYNAGPSRVADWLATNGDPRTGAVDMADWIELIPFSETRNYVQRVLESVEIYRAKQGAAVQVAGVE